MLVGTFAFANNVNEVSLSNNENATEIVNSLELVSNYDSSIIIDDFELFGTCYVTIGFYDSDGNKVAERTLQFNNVDSAQECSDIADAVGEALENL